MFLVGNSQPRRHKSYTGIHHANKIRHGNNALPTINLLFLSLV